ncbi:hypothetical protein NEOC65_000662 [Neochlamydia sp. AcF65]|nr:hypothetical protein [Neochlamydia sp. AcF65]
MPPFLTMVGKIFVKIKTASLIPSDLHPIFSHFLIYL